MSADQSVPTLPAPGQVWFSHVWLTNPNTGSGVIGKAACMIISVGPSLDRANAAGGEVRSCTLLSPRGTVEAMLTAALVRRIT